MNTFKILTVSLMAVALMACGGAQEDHSAQINDDTLQVAYVDNLSCDSGLQANTGTLRKSDSTYVIFSDLKGEGGGGPSSPLAISSTDAQTCAGYVWEVSGECTNCNDLLVEVGDSSAVIEVGENGEFNFTMQAISNEAPLLITPMYDGVLGIQSYADLLLDL